MPVALLSAQAVLWPAPSGVYLMGLILGLLGALVATGMVLIYRTNRIINFAQSALGLVPTVFAVELIVYSQVGYSVAALAGLALAALAGTAISGGIIRRFAHSSRLVLTAATIGLAQLCLGISIFLPELWGHATKAEDIAAPWTWEFAVDPLVFRAEHLLALVVAPISLAAVAYVLLRTRLGAAVRASADSSDRAALLGIPVQRLNMIIWAGASMLSFVGMFLRVSMVGLPPATLESQTALLAALAALTLGRFTRLGAVALVAVVLGVLEQAVVWNHPENPQVFAVVLAVLTLVAMIAHSEPATRLARDLTSSWKVLDEPRPLPAAVRTQGLVHILRTGVPVVALAIAVALPSLLGPGELLKASTVLILAIVGTSLVVLIGWAGQVSLGQMGFVAVGAAVGAVCTSTLHWDLAPTLALSGGAAAAAALLVGLPALRVRGMFLAVTTLAFSVATSAYLLNPRYADWIPEGRVERPTLLWRFDLDDQAAMYWTCLGAFAVAYLVVRVIRASRTGRVMVAQRDSETAAESFGISTPGVRLGAFAISGTLAGIAGCLLTHLIQSYPEQLVTPEEGIAVFSATIVGGIASPAGGLVGSLVFNASDWFLAGPLRYISTAVGVLVVLLVMPSGVSGTALGLRDRVLRRLFDRSGAGPGSGADSTTVDLRTETGGDRRRAIVHATRSKQRLVRQSGVERPLLEVEDLVVGFGDAPVIDGVDLQVDRQATLALLGTNGAGKSTILNAISGLVRPSTGKVTLDGRDITGLPAHQVARLGIAVCPGGRGVFPSLTVAENLSLAAWIETLNNGTSAHRTAEVLEMFPVLEQRRHAAAANLSGGEQQMLALGMAYIQGPRLLFIDELSLGLAPIVVEKLLAFIERLRERGVTIVVVEQSVSLALAITDHAVFLERGRICFDGTTAELVDHPDLYRSIYLAPVDEAGQLRSSLRIASGRATAPVLDGSEIPALAAVGATAHYGGVRALGDVSFELAQGTTLGIIGPNGAGKSTLLDVLSGVIAPTSGRIELAGDDVTALGLTARARLGLGRSFQDARLFPGLTVAETLAVAADRTLAVAGLPEALLHTPAHRRSERSAHARVDELLELFGLVACRGRLVGELSTGQRHVLDLACLVAAEPSVLLLDEPSSGLAQPEVEALGELLPTVRDEHGLSIVIVEHDIPFVSRVSDRLLAMDQGSVITVGTPAEALEHPAVRASYLGDTSAAVERSRHTLTHEDLAPPHPELDLR